MSVLATILLTVGGVIVGVLVTILVAKKYRPKKELSSFIIDFESTLQITDWIKSEVRILYGEDPEKATEVNSLERVRLIIKNTGNQAIKKGDIVEPIRIEFKEPATPVRIKKHFSDFKECTLKRTDSRKLEVSFDLMNPNEVLAVELMTTECEPDLISISGRGAELMIKGIKDLTLRNPKASKGSKKWIPLVTIWLCVAFLGPFVGILTGLDLSKTGWLGVSIGILYMIIVTAIPPLILYRMLFKNELELRGLRKNFENISAIDDEL